MRSDSLIAIRLLRLVGQGRAADLILTGRREVIDSGESQAGARRFAEGSGRHGS
jgi:hypothetical protein